MAAAEDWDINYSRLTLAAAANSALLFYITLAFRNGTQPSGSIFLADADLRALV